MIEPPNPDRLADITDATIDEFPDFVLLEQTRDHPQVADVTATTRAAVDDLPLSDVAEDAEIGVTAGSRGIHDMPEMLSAIVAELQDRGYDPFVFPAMGSHGGATPEGQREMLNHLGITEESLGCEIRSSLAVEEVGRDAEDRPIYAARDALDADAIVLTNRVKLHTDFSGDIESGLSKIAVIGLGKQRGASTTHKAGLAKGMDNAIPERAEVLFEEAPILGGIAMYENAEDRAAHIEGVPVDQILDREPELLKESIELFPTLPIEELDMLIVDEIGKNISGSGLDPNVIGRMLYYGQDEFDTPDFARIFIRSLTEESHHNGVGMGLADFIHQDMVDGIELTDTYINTLTGGEPARGRLPVIAPSDEIAMLLSYATTGVDDPADMRIGRVQNTLDIRRFLVSENVAEDLVDRDDIEVVEEYPLRLHGGDFTADPFAEAPTPADD